MLDVSQRQHGHARGEDDESGCKQAGVDVNSTPGSANWCVELAHGDLPFRRLVSVDCDDPIDSALASPGIRLMTDSHFTTFLNVLERQHADGPVDVNLADSQAADEVAI